MIISLSFEQKAKVCKDLKIVITENICQYIDMLLEQVTKDWMSK